MKDENVAIKKPRFDEIKWFEFFLKTHLVVIIPCAKMVYEKKIISFLLHSLLDMDVILLFYYFIYYHSTLAFLTLIILSIQML